MTPYHCERYGNPSSMHRAGREAFQAMDKARGQVSAGIGAMANEVVFTGRDGIGRPGRSRFRAGEPVQGRSHRHRSSGTSSGSRGSCEHLEHLRVSHHFTPPRSIVMGWSLWKTSRRPLGKETFWFRWPQRTMQIRTMSNISAASEIAEDGAAFHTDAVQAACRMPLDVSDHWPPPSPRLPHKFPRSEGGGHYQARHTNEPNSAWGR